MRQPVKKTDTNTRAAQNLRGIVQIIDAKGKPSPDMLANIRSLAIDALDVLTKPDPRTERIATVLLVIRQCTEVRERKVGDRIIETVYIRDHEGWKWAVSQAHRLGQA